MSIETMTKLATVTASTSVSSIDFSNIPQTYTDLKLVLSLRTNRSSGDFGSLEFLINNDSTTSYADRITYNYNSSALSNTDTGYTTLYMGGVNQTTQTSNVFSSHELYIPNYTSSKYKTLYGEWAAENNGTVTFMGLGGGIWKKTEAINRITISVTGFTFNQYSTATLYGVKAMRTVVGNSIKATGGAISFDGTYVYHVFNSSGTFTPTVPLSADYLVVAGGGGTTREAGGGAGGTRSTLTSTGGGGALEQPLSFIPNTSYTVTIGAGGVGGASQTNGSNSQLATITSTGGGAGAQPGSAGGSGGGGGRSSASVSRAGGAASPSGQGYAGGSGEANDNPDSGGGGGGGAGAAGTDGSGGTGGNGGNGIWTTLTNALSLGQLSNGNYFIGGGGGAGATTAGNAGLGGGGAGKTTSANGNNGSPNTGGGAGGIRTSLYPTYIGGSGGSGVVVVRYKA